MYYIQCIKKSKLGLKVNYSRWGFNIPNDEITIENLTDYFKNGMAEEKILQALIDDTNISIMTENDKEAEKNRLNNTPEKKIEKATVKADKKRALKKELNDANEEIEKALETPDKEDDKKAREKAEKIVKKLKDVDNG